MIRDWPRQTQWRAWFLSRFWNRNGPKPKDWLLMALAITLLSPILAVPDALYWDDWVLFSGSDLRQFTAEIGRPWTFPLFLLSSIGPWAYKLTSLFSLVGGAIAIHRLLGHWPGVGANLRLFGGAVYLLAPIAYSRMMASVLSFQLSTTLFLFAWLLIVKAETPSRQQRFLNRVVALALFFLAILSTTSLATLFLLPMLHLVINDLLGQAGFSWGRLAVIIRKRAWMATVPVSAFAATRWLFPPYGAYETYNEISLAFIVSNSPLILPLVLTAATGILALAAIFTRIKSSQHLPGSLLSFSLVVNTVVFFMLGERRGRVHDIWQVISLDEILNLDFAFVLLLTAGFVVSAELRHYYNPLEVRSGLRRSALISLAFGQIGLSMATIPYLAVGKTPTPSGAADRLELLLPVALTWVLVGTVQLGQSYRTRKITPFASAGVLLSIVPGALVFSLYCVAGESPGLDAIGNRWVPLAILWGLALTMAAAFTQGKLRWWPGLESHIFAGTCVAIMATGTILSFSLISIDWQKQKAVVQALAQTPRLEMASTITVSDATLHLNWDGRFNDMYEVTGWLRSAYGSDGILGVSSLDPYFEEALSSGELENPDLQNLYGFASWTPSGETVQVEISTSSTHLDFFLGHGTVDLEVVR